MDFDAVEAGRFSAGSGGDEIVDQGLYFRVGESACARFGVVGGTERRRADELLRRAHPGVVELNDG